MFDNTLNVSEMTANRDERYLQLAIDYDERGCGLDRLGRFRRLTDDKRIDECDNRKLMSYEVWGKVNGSLILLELKRRFIYMFLR